MNLDRFEWKKEMYTNFTDFYIIGMKVLSTIENRPSI